MIFRGNGICPSCGNNIKYYDSVSRVVRRKTGKRERVRIQRVKCVGCGKIHRMIPDFLFPYKQYEADIIRGVLDGIITSDTFEYEDYPCEMTMNRWKSSRNLRFLL